MPERHPVGSSAAVAICFRVRIHRWCQQVQRYSPNSLTLAQLSLITLSAVPSIWGLHYGCVWLQYTTTEAPDGDGVHYDSSRVGVADAAEPPEVVALIAVSPEAMVPAAVSSEVVAYAAQSPEAMALTSAPCAVVSHSNALSACHVVVKETVTELSLFPDASVKTSSVVSELPAFVEAPDAVHL